jgi:hypothetical protein
MISLTISLIVLWIFFNKYAHKLDEWAFDLLFGGIMTITSIYAIVFIIQAGFIIFDFLDKYKIK